ncbi:arginine deiminase-related protein [Pedobacter sp. JY14-1]|uniref:citrulline utilization hydrolase CtlX n=1 Tax=Pedobacter sp. JY14-1 TaxID=3034151 RepID=UPI0023E16DA0|nr:arginine deiminase-related protein [Pedobacter sp. JY14-1]
MQTTSHLLMIRPVDFKFNPQTAGNNKFQQRSENPDIQQQALKEFDNFAALLRENGVDVTVINDTLTPETPDSLFPNNWVSFHQDGGVYLYPMFSENRRQERRNDILKALSERFHLGVVTDLSAYEQQGQYLEGTGSMVLDRKHKIAYACLSVRTSMEVLKDFCRKSGYRAVVFGAEDTDGFPIYHTNVMMCVGSEFAVVCLDCVKDKAERELLVKNISATGKEIISITMDQMNHFAGNMLEVENRQGEHLLVLSAQAKSSLSFEQVSKLSHYARLISSPLYTIEKNGGGSARCMLAEIHLQQR